MSFDSAERKHLEKNPNIQTGYLLGEYDKEQLPQIVEHFAQSPFWKSLFDSSNQPITKDTVGYYLKYIPDLQKIKVVEGCSTQCDFCDHLAPKKVHSAPFDNFTIIVDELRALRELGFVQFSNPPSKVVFHSNGETLQYHYGNWDAHDLLSYINGPQLPQWQNGGHHNTMKLKTAGAHSPATRDALKKIVTDLELTLIFSYSFHQGSLLARTHPDIWRESTIENFQILEPLFNQGRLQFSIHSLPDETGRVPSPGNTMFHLEPQLTLLYEMLLEAGYTSEELALVFNPESKINGLKPLHLSYLRVVRSPGISVPDYLENTPSYAEHIQLRQGKIGFNYPSHQVFIAANTGEIFVNKSRYDRVNDDYPFDGLAQLPGRLGIPIDNGPSFFSSIARKLKPMEQYS